MNSVLMWRLFTHLQTVFICLLLPFLSKMWGIPFSQLPSYLKDGTACFLNINTSSIGKPIKSHSVELPPLITYFSVLWMDSGCGGAPILPLLFIIVNMGFNVSLLHLLKVSSAVVSCLASTFSGTKTSLKIQRKVKTYLCLNSEV